MINTTQSVNGGPYAAGDRGFQTSQQQLVKYEKALLKFLTVGPRLAHTKFLIHKLMPKNMGDAINCRRYFDIEKDPRKLKFDKESIDGPELKELHGTAVELKLEWFGNGISFNDVTLDIHIDNLMQVAMPILMKNSLIVMDNIAGLALYEGASKAFIKSYDGTTLALGADAAEVAAATKAPLNHDVLRLISKKMINNKETYTLSDGKTDITIRAKISGLKGGKYHVLVSEDGMDDLLEDPKFLDRFVKGISAQELRDNKIVSTYRYNLETVDNTLTIDSTDTDLATQVKVEGEGDLQVAFVLGEQFGADVKLAGAGVKMFTKLPNSADSGDAYGRYAFATYKLAYNAKVVNTAAIYAVVYKPTTFGTGSIVDSTITAPKK